VDLSNQTIMESKDHHETNDGNMDTEMLMESCTFRNNKGWFTGSVMTFVGKQLTVIQNCILEDNSIQRTVLPSGNNLLEVQHNSSIASPCVFNASLICVCVRR
jgi:hypothetical protein